ncbi:MAG TPA: ElyC/SanA/YdcF family protein [Prolixibacteraceae bacterium]|nr:ElyC/SanA/YdcF family protein [Prolixibacteraceae bacterium]
MNRKKYIKWFILSGMAFVLVIILVSNHTINSKTKALIFTETSSIPVNKTGLLLGTSKYLKSGKLNMYFEYRILATEALYKSGKIKAVVISGDNSRKDYNEPLDMKMELIKRGIPENSIYLDYAGFRTFDSVYRMKEIFGQKSFTVISQEFHNQRAVYIANSLGMEAIGFNAQDVNAYNGFKTKAREKLARVKVFIDMLTNNMPKYLGEQIAIE